MSPAAAPTTRVHLWLLAAVVAGALWFLTRSPEGPVQAVDRSAEATQDSQAPEALAPAANFQTPTTIQPKLVAPYRTGQAGRIVGRVFGSDGVPLEGARCTLAPGEPAWGFVAAIERIPGTDPLQAATDAEGRFALPAPSGSWSLAVEAEGQGGWWADHLRGGDDLEIRLTAPKTLDVSLVDGDGRPLVGARVDLLPGFRRLGRTPLASAVTDALGQAELPAHGPGDNYVSVVHPGSHYLVESVDSDTPLTHIPVALSVGTGYGVHGQIHAGAGSAALRAPLITVEAYSRGQSIRLQPECSADGSYATEAIFAPGETVRVSATAEGLGEVQAWTLVPMEPDPEGLRLDLTLAAPERVARGRLVDASGAGLAGAEVHLASIDPIGRGQDALVSGLMRPPHYTERWAHVTATDASGGFSVPRLAADLQYILALVDPTRDPCAPTFVWPALSTAGSTVELGQVTLPEAGGLFGVVRYDDGDPVAPGTVSVHLELIVSGAAFDTWRPSSWWRPLTTTTRSDGYFRFDGLAPGSYDIKWEGELVDNRAVVPSTLQGPIEVFVPRPADESMAQLVGRVLTPAGGPLSGVFVGIFEPDDLAHDDPVAMTFSELDGSFSLRAPAGRPLELSASDMRGRFEPFVRTVPDVAMSPSQSVQLETADYVSDPIIVLVVGPDGVPLEGIDVRLEPPENRHCGCVSFGIKTDDHGFAIYEQVAPAEHRITISDPLGRFEAEQYSAITPGTYLDVALED
ncbi:carboxypeptidase-like regulatory domain-containing protein [Engelhardtia mirabilis]|uniref:Nickel uptake substrate-specific transmembrane region n=1 Tax=Engelhardtia mirabilis TaxID=2528011 RepID=A0A518BKB7_9BACT|nr:Nickel uptake substrate-specific transmembrane region [Planctomycetes bacterium Pla133]QDV01748.1 Nickel uptake substrate-specific transmembrane region [Planctomycetes bacterium Pla86]